MTATRRLAALVVFLLALAGGFARFAETRAVPLAGEPCLCCDLGCGVAIAACPVACDGQMLPAADSRPVPASPQAWHSRADMLPPDYFPAVLAPPPRSDSLVS